MTEDRLNEPLKRQLTQLQQLVIQKDADIYSLCAKIRGYETLGSVCQEKITECQELKHVVKDLQAQVARQQQTTKGDPDCQEQHGASGGVIVAHADVACQAENSCTSLSSIDTQSLLSVRDTDSGPSSSAVTSQGVVLDFPPSDVSPRSVVETVAQVCSAVKKTVTHASEDTPLSSQLDQITIAVMKLEKQCVTQQMVVDGLNIENNNLKSTSSDKERQIATLREEIASLREQLVRRTDREHALSAENAEPPSMQEWVKVERASSQTELVNIESTPSTNPGHVTTTRHSTAQPTTTKQTALQRSAGQKLELHCEIQKLQIELESFKIANDQWKDHSCRTEVEHKRLTTELQQKLLESQQQVQQLRNDQEQQQRDLDRLLITAKEELLSEQRVRQDCESRLACVDSQMTQLQEQVAEQQQIIQALTDRRHNSLQQSLASVENNLSSNVTTPDALRTQVALLQEQIVIYKDDFYSERADRVRTQEAKDDIQSQLTRISTELAERQRKISQLQKDLTTAQSDRITLLRKIQEQEEVTHNLQQRIKVLEDQQTVQFINITSSEPSCPPCPPYSPPYSPPYGRPYSPPHRPPGSQWTCVRCTYNNIAVRNTCEMCGNNAPCQLPLMVENMPGSPQRFLARGIEQCDAASDAECDTVDDDTNK